MERAIEVVALVILVAGGLSGIGQTGEYSKSQTDSTFYPAEDIYIASENEIYSNSEYVYGDTYDVDTGAKLYQSDYERYMGYDNDQAGYQFYLEDYNRYVSE